MGWDELQTRAGQEIHKRLDLLSYRLGFGGARNGVRAEDGRGASGKFFFSPGELPGRTRILRERLPQVADAIVREAGDICAGRFSLLGYNNLDYGPEIDWHLDAFSGRRAPHDPWFKIRYLDFDEVGDHKVTWELNRHQHLVTLAKAWRIAGDSRYVGEVVSQWTSWQRANPYPLGINWASSLEVAFRSLSWLWVRELLAGCESVPSEFWDRLLQGLALNGRHIERYLSTYFSPNTHLIGEAAALFFIGTLCPRLPAARRWQQRGWDILLAEAARQVRLDGVYFEQSLYYHVYALDFFLHARQLAACNGIEIPASFDQTLLRMLDVLQTLSQAGTVEGFGDDDGGRVFNPRRNRVEHMQDPLALGAGIFGDFRAPELTEEAVWLLGLEDLAVCKRCAPPCPASKAFGAGGIYVMASADPVPQCLTIDAGPQGTGRSGHGHADALSVGLVLDGRRWLIDSGTYTYRSDTAEREFFRGTAAHNTLRVDGQDQAVADGPFAWTSIPNVVAERWLQGSTFTLFIGSHSGYERLKDPVLHRRFLFHVHRGIDGDAGFWLVRDLVEGQKVHQIEVFWHFASDLEVTKETGGFVAVPSPSNGAASGSQGLRLLPASPASWAHEAASAYVSPVYGVKERAPVVTSSARVELPVECSTLLVPGATSERYGSRFERLEADELVDCRSAAAYLYADGGTSHYFLFAGASDAWSFGTWSSDASVLYCCLKERRLTRLVLCGGSFVSLAGRTMVIHSRRVERFELEWREGKRETFSSDPAALDLIAAETTEFAS
jgi:hypothetical protein